MIHTRFEKVTSLAWERYISGFTEVKVSHYHYSYEKITTKSRSKLPVPFPAPSTLMSGVSFFTADRELLMYKVRLGDNKVPKKLEFGSLRL